MSTRTVWFVRHGYRLDFEQPEWVRASPRPHDAPLAERGRLQAKETGERLAAEPIDHVFTSPFLRAIETASIISRRLDRPFRIEPGLAETLLLQWFPFNPDFLPMEQLSSEHPHLRADHIPAVQLKYPETHDELLPRARTTIETLLNRHPGNLLLVGHGGSMSALCAALLNAKPSLHSPCCCLVRLDQADGRWTLTMNGRDTSHLSWSETQIRFA